MDGILASKSAVVTGASGDIGSQVAFILAEQGAEVIGTYNSSKERAEKIEGQASKKGLKLKMMKVNIGNEEEVKKFFTNLKKERFIPDILVNAAGHSDKRVWFSRPELLTWKDWVDVLTVDLIGTFNCCRECAPLMSMKRGGAIVNFASSAGVTGHTEGFPYTAAKAAIVAVTKSLAYYYAPKIRVNAVAPGNIDAGSVAWYNERGRRMMAEEAALKRLGKAAEVASAVLFLASDLSSYITGQVLLVDGGI